MQPIKYRRQILRTSRSVRIGPAVTKVLTLVLLAVFTIFYLLQSAYSSNSIIQLRELEQERSDLNKEISTLEINVNRLQSLQKLSDSAKELGLVPAEGPATIITLPER